MSTFNFREIESKWQKIWAEKGLHKALAPSSAHPPYMILVMFPYPSGHLHMGHVRNYTIGDVFARFYRSQGRAVLHPIGWDAFGLPAENAAIKNKTHPSTWTWSNIAHMRGQLKELGISYDWDREVATCDPQYYRWNQWIFIKMFEKGLVFRKKAPVNWCPTCQTVLANEQVQNGVCWRCGSEVTQKELSQWFFKITDYAKELLEGHKELGPTSDVRGWPDKVLTMQKNWIGESHGAYIDFPVIESFPESIRVFTTRPDTLYGATFVVLAPEHPLVEKITTADRCQAVNLYREQSKKLTKIARTASNREKSGEFTGAYANNPLTGKPIPIWIADYVLTDYGTGAIMAVPAHDQRDFDFASRFGIPVIQVIKSFDKEAEDKLIKAYEAEGVLINSGPFSGLSTDAAQKKIPEYLKEKGIGEPVVTYKLRDWLLSRQRYWGTPIPIVYCQRCGTVPVRLSDLPVTLPENVELTGEGESPLKKATEWINTTCPSCGGTAQRETDTMDTFVDSSWYYARYTDNKNVTLPFERKQADGWIPVHQYVGGIEHACMHLIYSRFFHKVFRDMGLVSSNEPFRSLLTQGMVTLGGSAMSKSKGNVVDPKTVIDKFGADTCRMFILFAAPPTQELEWSDSQVEGIWRFLNRVWRLVLVFSAGHSDQVPKRSFDKEGQGVSGEELMRTVHLTIKKVTGDISRDFGFNTAISSVMELVNKIYLYADLGDDLSREAVETVVRLLSPFAPHLCEEAWQQMGHENYLSLEKWPLAKSEFLSAKEFEIVIQVNGKVRDKVKVPSDWTEDKVKTTALETLGKRGQIISPIKTIFVPQKLINFVVGKN